MSSTNSTSANTQSGFHLLQNPIGQFTPLFFIPFFNCQTNIPSYPLIGRVQKNAFVDNDSTTSKTLFWGLTILGIGFGIKYLLEKRSNNLVSLHLSSKQKKEVAAYINEGETGSSSPSMSSLHPPTPLEIDSKHNPNLKLETTINELSQRLDQVAKEQKDSENFNPDKNDSFLLQRHNTEDSFSNQKSSTLSRFSSKESLSDTSDISSYKASVQRRGQPVNQVITVQASLITTVPAEKITPPKKKSKRCIQS